MIILSSKPDMLPAIDIETKLSTTVLAQSPAFINGIRVKNSIFGIPTGYYEAAPAELLGNVKIIENRIESNGKSIKSGEFMSIGNKGRAAQSLVSTVYRTKDFLVIAPTKGSLTVTRTVNSVIFFTTIFFGLLMITFQLALFRSPLITLFASAVFIPIIIYSGLKMYISYAGYLQIAPITTLIDIDLESKTIYLNGTFARNNFPWIRAEINGNLYVGDNISKFLNKKEKEK